MDKKEFEITITKEQIKDWLIDAYKTKDWGQINKLIVLFGGEYIEDQKNMPPPPRPPREFTSLYLG